MADMAAHIEDPGRGRVKKVIFRVRRGGKRHKLSTATTSLDAARRFRERLEILIERHRQGDGVPPELKPWVRALPDKTAQRLAALGLIDARQRQAEQPLTRHLDDYEAAVAARRNNTAGHARRMANQLRRLADTLNWHRAEQLDADAAQQQLHDWSLAPATTAKYLVAFNDFHAWAQRTGRLARHARPAAAAVPRPVDTFDRRPLEPAEWQQLADYLEHAPPRRDGQNHQERWTRPDRRLIYESALRTAFRKNELRALRVHHLRRHGRVDALVLPGRFTKNGKDADVPIPADLAQRLRAHIAAAELEPDAPLFWISRGRNRYEVREVNEGGHRVKRRVRVGAGGAKHALHRDLRDAGLGHLLDIDGRVTDFHSLRATAITWWLEGHTPSGQRLSPEQVRRLARLSSLSTVQRYIRGARFEDHAWLTPPEVETPDPRAANEDASSMRITA